MLIRHLKVTGLLSFGPAGLDLELTPLNVLIGPNGSGKSNLLEIFSLLRAAPRELSAPIRAAGGIHEWLWQGDGAGSPAIIDAVVDYPAGRDGMALRHVLQLTVSRDRLEVLDERIENERPQQDHPEPYIYYRFQQGHPVLLQPGKDRRELRREQIPPDGSILAAIRDPDLYPELGHLQAQYEAIRLYRSWQFGPLTTLRRATPPNEFSTTLADGAENLASVLSNLRRHQRSALLASLQEFYEDIEDLSVSLEGGNLVLYIEEQGRTITASRLSDGTLRYLALLAILHHPEPPPLVAIDEPELGLHPDILPHLAELLVTASERMQLVVTTHSTALVDALSEQAGSVIVCGKEGGESRFERLEAGRLAEWLSEYSLGQLWSRGEIGGNRW